MPRNAPFAFSDNATFDQNIADFSAELVKLDAVAGPVLQGALSTLANGDQDKGALLDALETALATPPAPTASTVASSQPSASSPSARATPAAAPPTAIHWFLEGLEIEGFRGINNEGTPLTLKFKYEETACCGGNRRVVYLVRSTSSGARWKRCSGSARFGTSRRGRRCVDRICLGRRAVRTAIPGSAYSAIGPRNGTTSCR